MIVLPVVCSVLFAATSAAATWVATGEPAAAIAVYCGLASISFSVRVP